MPFIRGIIFSSEILDACKALRDQLQLLQWGGLRLAVLRTQPQQAGDGAEAAAEPPAAGAASAEGGVYGGCEGVTELQLGPMGAAGVAASDDDKSDAAAAAAESAVSSWAAGEGLQWPGEVVVLGAPGDVAAALSSRLRRGEQQQEGEGEGEGEGEELPGFSLRSAEAVQAAPWQRLRLALAHANLRRAMAEAGPGPGPGPENGGTAPAGAGDPAATGAAPPPSPPPPPPLVVVGTAMKASRERDLAKEGLLNLVPRDGVVFAPLDLSSPLESQLPFHAILHKASDELEPGPEGCGPRFGPRVRALADFAAGQPGVSLVDPLEAAAKVINRTELARVCDSLSSLDLDVDPRVETNPAPGAAEADGGGNGGGEGDGGDDDDDAAAAAGRPKRRRVAASAASGGGVRVRVRAPRSTTVSSYAAEEMEAARTRLGCPPPYIVKPVVACGTPDSHCMALVLLPEGLMGLEGLPLPAVFQEFVNHDATIFKVYVAGDKVFHTVRPSIPNAPHDRASALRLAPAGLLRFDSLKSLPTSLQPPPPAGQETGGTATAAEAAAAVAAGGPRSGPPAAPPSQAVLERLAAHLRAELGLSLFGFDVVIAAAASSGGGEQGGQAGQVRAREAAQELVVVDVNYFPSYRGAEGAPELFCAAVRGTYERQQRERREGGCLLQEQS